MVKTSNLDQIKSKLKEQLGEEPGIMSFAYPYVKFWNELKEDEVKQSWSSFSEGAQEGILYTHIPFCMNKCGYCDYATNFGVENRHDEYKSYIDAVEGETELLTPFTRNIKFSAVYFGGGTPTIFCEEGLERIIDAVTSNFLISPSAEISVEVYPFEKMLRNKLAMLQNVGVNRVSIGVQDFDDEVIAFTGRRYTGEEASRIVSEAKDLFDTVNIDLICGLPKQKKWGQTLEQTLDLEPQQITVQPFSNRHPGIRFHHPKYNSLLPNLDQVIEMYDLACRMLGETGYTQTSRHQFTKGVEHQYEQKISQSVARLGLGVHSISLLPELTYKNFTSLKKYKDATGKGVLPIERGFRITRGEAMRSYLFYSLSADCGGLSLSEGGVREKFGTRIQDAFPNEVQALQEEDLIKISENTIDLTSKGVYFTSVLQRTFYNQSFLK